MFRTSRMLLILTLAIAGLTLLGHAQTNAHSGAVFVMTNNAERNEIVAYKRNADGTLMEGRSFLTGGRGSGGVTDPLGSQGSLTLTQDRSFLLAVNAGSGDISVFRVFGDSLWLVDKTPCGGSEPVAVAQLGHLVYVVNAGAASNVTGFWLDSFGRLYQIPHSTTFLTTTNSGASSLAFSPDGQFLLATEKLTNNIDAFHINADGTLAPIVVNSSAGPGLFAILFAPNGTALAVETGPAGGHNASAISSYSLQTNGTLTPISTSVPTLGTATCWHVVTPNGRFVYTSNAGSATISGLSIGANGSLTPVSTTILATLPSGSTNLDIAVSADGKFLYTLDSGTGTVGAFGIDSDGTLTTLSEANGVSASSGFNGIAAN
ncbi:MAG TPA: beta-propeller fold lactonase family protein [Verrucomicrobiae bacterium]|nr:beta-propeller fold lactonase family protein [Verrucomicrobiae bacterium]